MISVRFGAINNRIRFIRPLKNSAKNKLNNNETVDEFHRGRIRVIQSKTGYRFALDAPLLADFIEIGAGDDILEMGTGNGIIPLLLAGAPFRKLTALEIQTGPAALARRNVALNGLAERVEIIRADFRDYRPGRRFDVVFSNPPYIKVRTGFLSATGEKSIAKHELTCDILEVMRAASRLLKAEGRAYFIYPAARADELRAAASANGLRVRLSRLVRPRPGDPPAFVLAELGFGPGRERIRRVLTLKTAAGADTPEARRIYEGRPRVTAHR
jgi:tRNA1Val (adenine37-N6)-methyltransferase